MNDERVAKLISDYHNKKKQIDKLNSEFSKVKKQFYQQLEEIDVDSVKVLNMDDLTEELFATRVQPTTITFDVDKVEKKIGKKRAEAIITKEYTINDFQGLVKYLQSCGVNPRVFKKYIDVDKQIDKDKLDNLSELGLLSLDDLSGAYSVKVNNPFYRITANKIKSEENEKE